METLHFRFDNGRAMTPAAPCIVGVLGSGNLEVLVEGATQNGACAIDVTTAVTGFDAIWEAVLRDFFERHRVGDVRISVNDAGATPATVALRLDQAIEAYAAQAHHGAGQARP
jgi:malonate decarboxylase delta subunit